MYKLIAQKVRKTHLPRHLAAIALASEKGINISPFASDEDLSEIRQTAPTATPVPPVVLPSEQTRPRQRPSRPKLRAGTHRRGKSVFVVHGRNEKLRRAMFAFLRSIGLTPIEWQKAIQLTGKASPYVGDILDTAFRQAVAVVVILSAEDEARLMQNFVRPGDPEHEKKPTGQPRSNVIFEAGMAFGKNPDSTVLVQVGTIRPFSDIAGRHAVRLSNTPESRRELITKLANAGCNVDASGADWMTEGNFEE